MCVCEWIALPGSSVPTCSHIPLHHLYIWSTLLYVMDGGACTICTHPVQLWRGFVSWATLSSSTGQQKLSFFLCKFFWKLYFLLLFSQPHFFTSWNIISQTFLLEVKGFNVSFSSGRHPHLKSYKSGGFSVEATAPHVFVSPTLPIPRRVGGTQLRVVLS